MTTKVIKQNITNTDKKKSKNKTVIKQKSYQPK